MGNWYVSREAIKNSAGISGSDLHSTIDAVIESKSREVERHTRRIFIPKTQTRLFRWPQRQGIRSWQLDLDEDLQSVITLQTKAQDSSPTTISSSDYFTEPNNFGPPYDTIEIDLSSSASFESGDSSQRTISVAGSWGFSADTRSTGTVASGLDSDATATSMVCSNASLIDVGDTLLIESEQVFVSERTALDIGKNISDASVTADLADVTITMEASHGLLAGEVIRIDSELMFIESVSTNDLTVIRAYDGSTLAAHSNGADVFHFRTLTIERGANGTTGATHADATAISKYEPPFDIRELIKAETISHIEQDRSAWGRVVGAGENQRQVTASGINRLRDMVVPYMKRLRSAAI